MTFRKYLVLAAIVLFGSSGVIFQSHGMKQIGAISFARPYEAVFALLNPWVLTGTLLLIGFFVAYVSALSWADLSYVYPATSIGYVLVALLALWFLGEQITLTRWIGILLIVAATGFIAGQPHETARATAPAEEQP